MGARLSRDVHVAPSVIHRFGLFASRGLKEGAYIGRYRGYRTRREGRYVLWVCPEGENCVGVRGLNLLRFLNHSDTPNAVFDGFKLYAKQDIDAGEELTIDYDAREEADTAED